MEIDIAFDFRQDAGGRDPDRHSPTLRRYHQLLWGRALPNGRPFDLTVTTPGAYLHHSSDLGDFVLSSDSVIPTFTRWSSMKHITSQVAEDENEAFRAIGYTIGGMMVFPANSINRQWTINQARGCSRAIADRMDLTLECIRRHYEGGTSPLSGVLGRYPEYFSLFGDFRGYVSHFLLDDLLRADGTVDYLMPFDDFRPPSVPTDVASYLQYRSRTIDFVQARNQRISDLTG